MDAEFIINTFHQQVKKCCASCQHRGIDNEGTRVCALMNIVVKPNFCCTNWNLREGLDRAGMWRGTIKKREYLIYAMMVRREEDYAIQNGTLTEEQRKTVEEIRCSYREMTIENEELKMKN